MSMYYLISESFSMYTIVYCRLFVPVCLSLLITIQACQYSTVPVQYTSLSDIVACCFRPAPRLWTVAYHLNLRLCIWVGLL